jgi:Galactose oxidase, central domain
MTTARFEHTETPLGNGKVLIAGSVGGSGDALASAELYDEAAGTFTATGNMTGLRSWHTATQVVSGKVLIAGGISGGGINGPHLASAEVYDPKAGRFTATGSMTKARSFHTATLLTDGSVLIAGGTFSATVEVFNPSAGTFTAIGSMSGPRQWHTATLLTSGKVLLAGGDVSGSAELYQ